VIVQQSVVQNRAARPWLGQVLLILFGFPLACAACGALYGLAFAFVDWYFTGHGEALTILPHRLAIGGTIIGLPFGLLSAVEVLVLALGRGATHTDAAQESRLLTGSPALAAHDAARPSTTSQLAPPTLARVHCDI
jgi:hypothetical protein